jgi:hypothetical protein
MIRRINIGFDIEVSDREHTDEQLEEWLRFELNDNGEMDGDNPFAGVEVVPIFGTFGWEDK